MENPSHQLHQVVGLWDVFFFLGGGRSENKTWRKRLQNNVESHQNHGFPKHVLEMVGFSTSFRMLQEGSHL